MNEITVKDVGNAHQNKLIKNAPNEKVNSNLIGGGRNIHLKRQKNKPQLNIEDSIPKITDILNLVEEEKHEDEISLLHRIRLNRKGKLVIDRYFKSSNSTNPFDDSFDNIYNPMKKYDEDLSK